MQRTRDRDFHASAHLFPISRSCVKNFRFKNFILSYFLLYSLHLIDVAPSNNPSRALFLEVYRRAKIGTSRFRSAT